MPPFDVVVRHFPPTVLYFLQGGNVGCAHSGAFFGDRTVFF